MTDAGSAEGRLLVLAPTSKDAALTESMLARARVACTCCADLEATCRELASGAGALLLPEEVVAQSGGARLTAWLADQPPWSDLPVLVLARPGADSDGVARAMDQLGNVTVLERPIRVAALVSAVRTALRARQRQYQIRDHLAERERAAAELRANDRRKDEFLAILSHELRNPLAPIRNALHVIRMTGKLDATAAHLGDIMERQVEHMVRLVDDLLEVSRITRGKIEIRKERIDLTEVIRSATETSQPLIDAAGHQLLVDLPSEPMVVEGDPIRLEQVFANLLNNAAKYTDAGGTIRLEAHLADSFVTISVRDTGMGIPQAMLSRVFDMFTQVERHSDRAQGGLGIGLTLVKSLVELHGGSVEALSDGLGRGSAFIVRLPPSAPIGAVVTDACSPAAPMTPPPRRVLVVDDNRDSAESLSMVLRLLGAEVDVAFNGPDALEMLVVRKPRVVVLDIGMPGMDGHEVARRIRAQPELRDLTLIALTGRGHVEDKRRSQAAGFDYHLIKPVDIPALETLFRSLETRPKGVRA